MERMTFTVEEMAKVMGIGRNSAYEAVRTGQIPAIKIGRRLLVPRAALAGILDTANNLGLGNSDKSI